MDKDSSQHGSGTSSSFMDICGGNDSSTFTENVISTPNHNHYLSKRVSSPTLEYHSISFHRTKEESIALENVDTKEKIQELCSKCALRSNVVIRATHFCKNCGPCGKYMCEKCLNSHNVWLQQEHKVKSLSVNKQRKSFWQKRESQKSSRGHTDYADIDKWVENANRRKSATYREDTGQSLEIYSSIVSTGFSESSYHTASETKTYYTLSEEKTYHTPSDVTAFHRPSDDRAFHRPTDGRAFHRPTDGRAFQTPSDARTFHRPSDDRAFHRPTDGRAFHRPTDGRAFQTPSDARTFHRPSDRRAFHRPTDGRAFQTPSDARTFHTPSDRRAFYRPTDGRVYNTPSDDIESTDTSESQSYISMNETRLKRDNITYPTMRTALGVPNNCILKSPKRERPTCIRDTSNIGRRCTDPVTLKRLSDVYPESIQSGQYDEVEPDSKGNCIIL